MEAAATYCMVMTAVDEEAAAEKLAQQLVDARLVACVQIQEVTSFYAWQGQSRRDKEYLLLIKSRQSLYTAIEAFIREHHSYQVPEILQVPVTAGSADYLAWMREQTRHE